MPKDKLRAAALGGSADDVEMAFYEAMQNGDIERLMACWSDEEDMFTNGTIQAHPRRLRKVESLTSAVHSVIETIQILTPDGPREAFVTATNVYHRTAQGWRMVVHHASPGAEGEAPEIGEAPQVLH
jgi:ketosteroid isomerase-like protein